MKLRKNILAMMMAAILLPSVSFAQTTTSSSTHNELVSKLIASLMEQVKMLQAQLISLKEKETFDTTTVAATTSPIKINVPEFVQKKALLTSIIDDDTYLNLIPAKTGKYSLLPVHAFNIESIDGSASLSKLSVRLVGTEKVKITKAYLYQGDSLPLTSTSVSNSIATFVIPKNLYGASFETNIPTKFTVKVDVAGVGYEKNTTNNISRCKGDCIDLNNVTTSTKLIPFTINSTIRSSDIQLVDSLGQIYKTISGTATNTIKVVGYECVGRCA